MERLEDADAVDEIRAHFGEFYPVEVFEELDSLGFVEIGVYRAHYEERFPWGDMIDFENQHLALKLGLGIDLWEVLVAPKGTPDSSPEWVSGERIVKFYVNDIRAFPKFPHPSTWLPRVLPLLPGLANIPASGEWHQFSEDVRLWAQTRRRPTKTCQGWLGEKDAPNPPTDEELIIQAIDYFDCGETRRARWGTGDPMEVQKTPDGYRVVSGDDGRAFYDGPDPRKHQTPRARHWNTGSPNRNTETIIGQLHPSSHPGLERPSS
jgi:hypothetical protein